MKNKSKLNILNDEFYKNSIILNYIKKKNLKLELIFLHYFRGSTRNGNSLSIIYQWPINDLFKLMKSLIY